MKELKAKTGWRRILAALLAVFMVFGTVETAVVAVDNDENVIKMGVPVLDGQVDDIYKQSLTLTTGVGDNAYASPWGGDEGKIYFLYSANYLYICAEIQDNSVVSAGQVYVAKTNPYQNDCCEFRLSLDGGKTTFKVGIDAYGLRAYGTSATEMSKLDYSKILYKTTYSDTVDGAGYVVEAAIPCYDGGVLNLLNTGKLGFKLQLNDLDYDGAYCYFATDYAGEGAKGLVYYDLSTEVVSGGTATGDEDLDSEFSVPEEMAYQKLSFGGDDANYKMKGKGVPGTSEHHGTWTKNTELGTIDIAYSDTAITGAVGGARYVMKGYFDSAKEAYNTEYKYLCVLYAADNPDGATAPVQMILNETKSGGQVILNPDVQDTNGNFVLTVPCELDQKLIDRLATPAWCDLNFVTDQEGGSYQVKAYYFFKTAEEANDFRDYQKLAFTPGGNSKINTTAGYGVYEVDEDLGVINIGYDAASKIKGTNYTFQGYFNKDVELYNMEYKYIRVLYAAQNPEGVDTVEMKFVNRGKPYTAITLDPAVKNTNGQFVLSEPCELSEDMVTRMGPNTRSYCAIQFMTTEEGGCYQVEAYYFFKTAEEAAMFDPSMDNKTVLINGTDLSQYRIVVPENDGIGTEMAQAKSLKQQIFAQCGLNLPVVTDSEAATEYELLIGRTNRPESQTYYSEGGRFHPSFAKYSVAQYYIERVGNKVVLASAMAPAIEGTVALFAHTIKNSGNPVKLDAEYIGEGCLCYDASEWSEVTNVEDPESFEDSFNEDKGYWSKDSDKASWVIAADGENKVFSSGDNAYALSYLHIFETNVSYEAKMKYTADAAGAMGLVLRHTSDYAYINAGYDFEAGEWFIDSREGEDFLCYRLASAKATLTAGQWYTLKAVVDGSVAKLYVDGVEVLSTDVLTQVTPGKIGVYAEKVTAYMDDVSIDLLSGQGSIMKNVVHTKLPDDIYREGGSIWEMSDGSLRYLGRSDGVSMGGSFASYDGGKTWERCEPWTQLSGVYAQILRLNNGSFLQIKTETIDGVKQLVAYTSADEGKTWTYTGAICPAVYSEKAANGKDVGAGNVNDKITQMSDGRIFYNVGYETSSTVYGKYKVFCEFYYSDDNGVTWTKSETDSFEIEGNEDQAKFGECKIMETSTPGVLRIYNSWNWYGCMVYSESTDNGVTWGPLVKMEDYVCSCSSLQFVRDPYADNNTTYYMVWVKEDAEEPTVGDRGLPRSHLALARTTDGVHWESLGDVWRWEHRFEKHAHAVDPVIQVTEDYVIVGSGICEKVDAAKSSHYAQRQHIFSILKSSLEKPVISGVVDGKTYCGTQEVTVTNANGDLESVTLNGTAVTLTEGKFTVSAKEGQQTIVATNEAGNVTTVKITVNAGHTGGTATCKDKAVCTVCGEAYGELAAHKGGTATCEDKAVCTVCGEAYGELAAHKGGEATCTAKAKCSVCGEAYGELNADKHTKDAKWTVNADKHSKAYECCGKVVVAEEAHELSDGKCECGYEAPQQEESGDSSNTGNTSDNSNTGDSSEIVLFAGLLVVSALAAGVLLVPDFRKKLMGE